MLCSQILQTTSRVAILAAMAVLLIVLKANRNNTMKKLIGRLLWPKLRMWPNKPDVCQELSSA